MVRLPEKIEKYEPSNRVLGFDYGLRWIGMAVADKESGIVTLLKTVQGGKKLPDKTKDQLKKAILEWNPSQFVVGLPLDVSGKPLWVAALAKNFANWLEKTFSLPIYLQDERFSTVEAKEHLFNRLGFKGLTADRVNAMAAGILLQDFLLQGCRGSQ